MIWSKALSLLHLFLYPMIPKLRILIFSVSFLIGQNSFAQFNFLIGYSYNWSSFKSINDIISAHQTLHPEYSKKIKPLHGMHGIELGFRYKFESIGLNLRWSNQINNNYSLTTLTSPELKEEKRQYYYKNQLLGIGLEFGSGYFTLGGYMDYRWFDINGRYPDSEDKFDIIDNQNWGSTIFSQLEFPVSSRMALQFRIHYSFPWNKLDVQNFSTLLSPGNSSFSSKEKLNQWGISLIFANGFQPRY